MPSPRTRLLALGLLAALAFPLSAEGSIKIASNAHNASLQVNSQGVATVFWTTSSGVRRTAVVKRNGRVVYGRVAPGRDVSRPSSAYSLPLLVAQRQTSSGRLWALQNWKRLRTGPWELRFSRWFGAPTRLVLRAWCCKWRSEVARGRATFHGRPIYGYRFTRSGVPLDGLGRNVYIDSFRQNRWIRLMGILTHRPTGKYGLWIRKHWRGTQYRAKIVGPNWGRTLAPDATAWSPSALS
jgi:hypothetical protein